MRYCPHCERPVNTLDGSCPHCGQPFGGVPMGPAAVSGGRSGASALAAGDDEFPNEDADLDLAFDPHDSAGSSPSMQSVPPVSVEAGPGGRGPRAGFAPDESLPADEIARAAGVSPPGNLLGAPLYAWRAFRRLPALRAEVAARGEEARQSEKFRRESFALWARNHGREMGAETAMRPFVEAVLRANKTLQAFGESHQGDFERFAKLDGAVAEETKAAERRKEELTVVLGTAEAEWRRRTEGLKRSRAKLQRGDIELRNLERVAQGKVGEGSAHHARFVEAQQVRAAAAGESAQAEAEERSAKAEATRVRNEILDIDRRLEARREAARNDPVRRRVEGEQEAHRLALEEALSAAAAQALTRRIVPVDSPDAQRLVALREAEASAKRASRIHQAALDGVDRRTIAIGVAIPGALVVTLFVLAVLLR